MFTFVYCLVKDLLHIPNFNLKLYIRCLPLIYELLPLQTGARSSMSNERDNEFLYNFLIICRYFNLVCNKRIILKQAEHSQVVKIFTF